MAEEAAKQEDQEPPVEIVDELPKGEEGAEQHAKPEDGDGEDKIVTGDEGAEELKRKLEQETARANAAEGVARAAAEEVTKAKAAVEDGEAREIQTAIDVAKRNLEIAKQNYRNARAGNDVDAEVEATEAIAQAKADLNALEAGKAAREQAKKNPQPGPQAQFRADPVEVVAASLANWPQSQAWVRAHPEMARDPNKWKATVAASDLALASGLTADTPAYFSHIENTLQANGHMQVSRPAANGNGNGDGTVVKTEESAMSQASRPVPPAAAPPSRSSNPTNPGQRPGTIRLTREQAEIAELSFPKLVKEKGAAAAHRAYAQSMIDAKANGKLN